MSIYKLGDTGGDDYIKYKKRNKSSDEKNIFIKVVEGILDSREKFPLELMREFEDVLENSELFSSETRIVEIQKILQKYIDTPDEENVKVLKTLKIINEKIGDSFKNE